MKKMMLFVGLTAGLGFSLILVCALVLINITPSVDTLYQRYIYQTIPKSLKVIEVEFSKPFSEPADVFFVINLSKADTKFLISSFDFKLLDKSKFNDKGLQEDWLNYYLESSGPTVLYGYQDDIKVPIFDAKYVFIKEEESRTKVVLIDESERILIYYHINL